MNPTERSALGRDRGSGTVTLLGIISALIVLLAVVHVFGAAALAKGQAARGADLAALAAADTARGLNAGDPCTVAEQVVARNEAILEDCTVGGEHPSEVQVRVSRSVDIAILPSQLTFPQLQATASARAGPPDALNR